MEQAQATPEANENAQEQLPLTEQEQADKLYGDTANEDNKETENNSQEASSNQEESAEESSSNDSDKEESQELKEGEWNLAWEEETLIPKDVWEDIVNSAKEKGWDKEQVQSVLNRDQELLNRFDEHRNEQWQNEVEGWATQLKEDKDFGGVNFDKNAQYAQKAFQEYVDPETRELFNEHGYGNFPGLVKAFAKIGKHMSSDTYEQGRTSGDGAGKLTPEQILYGNNNN